MALGMKSRKGIGLFPKAGQEIAAFTFLVGMIHVTSMFELFVVLPMAHPLWSAWYTIHFINGAFIFLNVISNFVAVIMTDTSIAGETLPSIIEPGWRKCEDCETVCPPRSYHCQKCNTCILKRDHHCMFTGRCIGHLNQRYFLMFVLYMFIGCLYSTFFTSDFIWRNVDFKSPITYLKIVFPLCMVVFGLDPSVNHIYLIIYLLNFFGMAVSFVLLWIQLDLAARGKVQYEDKHHVDDYNFGLKRNIEDVFGKRWYIAWICPFIQSELPNNGIHWKTSSSMAETTKQN